MGAVFQNRSSFDSFVTPLGSLCCAFKLRGHCSFKTYGHYPDTHPDGVRLNLEVNPQTWHRKPRTAAAAAAAADSSLGAHDNLRFSYSRLFQCRHRVAERPECAGVRGRSDKRQRNQSGAHIWKQAWQQCHRASAAVSLLADRGTSTEPCPHQAVLKVQAGLRAGGSSVASWKVSAPDRGTRTRNTEMIYWQVICSAGLQDCRVNLMH